MPRGDGRGPAGGGGRGCGRGRGMRHKRGGACGQGQGRRVQRNLQAGVGNEMTGLPGVLDSTPKRITTPVAYVDEEACKLCGACQAVCPSEAISLGDTAVKVSVEACCGCGACVEACPHDAIQVN